MSKLGQVVEAVERYNKFVLDQVKRARTDEKFGRDLLGRWNDTKAKIPVSRAPTGLELPRLALPEIDEPGEIGDVIQTGAFRGSRHALAVAAPVVADDAERARELRDEERPCLSLVPRPVNQHHGIARVPGQTPHIRGGRCPTAEPSTLPRAANQDLSTHGYPRFRGSTGSAGRRESSLN